MDEKMTSRPAVVVKAIDRRDIIKKGLKIGGIAYAAPIVLGASQHVGAASPSPGINPLCTGATCATGTVPGCSNGLNDCFCYSTADGRGFCGNNFRCAVRTGCGPGNTCPAGFICVINSCCVTPRCVSVTADVCGQPIVFAAAGVTDNGLSAGRNP